MYCILTLWCFEHRHLLEFLDTRLRFTRLGGIVAKLVDKGLQVRALDHLVLVLTLRGLTTLFFGGVERVEVGALVVVEALRMLVDNIGGDFIEERTIVRNDEEGTRVGLEVGGEEGYGGYVQHVGGFYGELALRFYLVIGLGRGCTVE